MLDLRHVILFRFHSLLYASSWLKGGVSPPQVLQEAPLLGSWVPAGCLAKVRTFVHVENWLSNRALCLLNLEGGGCFPSTAIKSV